MDSHTCEVFSYRDDRGRRISRAVIRDDQGAATDIRECHDESYLRARIENVYPGINYVTSGDANG